MREINKVIVHCSATTPSQDIGVTELRQWHITERGWSDIGYHFVIRRDGNLETGRPIERPGAHAKGHNKDSVGVCLIGGVDEYGKPVFNYTYHQMDTLWNFLKGFTNEEIIGHRDLPGVKKSCPCFDVRSWLNDF
ncbi:MAG: N-acetylmuramoyl-L-alanine amidase [Alphaproteobacteria bacterium]